MLVTRGRGRGVGELVFNGYGVSVLQDEELSGWMVVMVARVLSVTELYS